MNTSSFKKAVDNPNAVSIARSYPYWFPMKREYRMLAPPGDLLWAFKSGDIDEAIYMEKYHRMILDKMNAQKVYAELGENAVLCCWEAAGRFCHRRIVADWLKEKLGVEVPEL